VRKRVRVFITIHYHFSEDSEGWAQKERLQGKQARPKTLFGVTSFHTEGTASSQAYCGKEFDRVQGKQGTWWDRSTISNEKVIRIQRWMTLSKGQRSMGAQEA
jgi:hypothetical protein